MSIAIASAPWASHNSLVHLHSDVRQLRSDYLLGAAKDVVEADRAAVQESRRVLNTHRAGLLDITV